MRSEKTKGIILVLITIGLLAIWFATIFFGRDLEGSKRVLEDSGYTNVQMTGYRPFAGSDDDTFSDGFEATSPTGKHVTGSVTYGLMKGKTIRLD